MYAAKVRIGLDDCENGNASWPVEAQSTETRLEEGDEPWRESIAFASGNPRVEHTVGVVHLYREMSGSSPGIVAPALPDGHGERICLLAIPMDIGIGEVCTFLGAFLDSVREMQLVRRQESKRTYLAFLTFDSVKQAALFFKNYNGKAFSSLEPHICCKLVFIKDLEILSGTKDEDLKPPPGGTELPTCPVCLERLDEHISGIVTTVCNHKFHSQCLRLWGDDSCPVCRYTSSEDTTTSKCTVCGTSQDLWICLICGHVGCGRYREGHSRDHWKETGHVYALELETQRVWDYVGDGYVHRLIQSKTDGKLVEVPAPGVRATASQSSLLANCSLNEVGPQHDPELDDALFSSKLDMFASEYNNLLVTELDSQRKYFEGLLQKAEDRRLEEAATQKEDEKLAKELRVLANSKAMLETRVADITAKLKAANVARQNAEAQNDSLTSNQAAFMKKLTSSESKCAALEKENADLKEQVRDLMLFLDARQMTEQDPSLQGGSASVADATKSSRRRNARRK